MSKLSHIDEIEQRKAAGADTRIVQDTQPVSAQAETGASQAAQAELPAEQDEEFHGIDSEQPMGALHKTLIVLACIVVVVAILYIVNSWTHFM